MGCWYGRGPPTELSSSAQGIDGRRDEGSALRAYRSDRRGGLAPGGGRSGRRANRHVPVRSEGRPDRRSGGWRDPLLPAPRGRDRGGRREADAERRQGVFAGRDLGAREGGPPGCVGRRLPRARQRLAEHLPLVALPTDAGRVRAQPASRRGRHPPVLRRGQDRLADPSRPERPRRLQPPLLRERQHGARARRRHARPGPAAGRQLRGGLLPRRRRRRHCRCLPVADVLRDVGAERAVDGRLDLAACAEQERPLPDLQQRPDDRRNRRDGSRRRVVGVPPVARRQAAPDEQRRPRRRDPAPGRGRAGPRAVAASGSA